MSAEVVGQIMFYLTCCGWPALWGVVGFFVGRWWERRQ